MTVSPIAVGPVTLDIAAGVAHDAAGNGNTAAVQAVSDFVSTRPSVTITGLPDSFVGQANLSVQVVFSEPVTGFVSSDLLVTNGAVTGISGSGASYTVQITSSGTGDVSVQVPDAVAVNSHGAPNTASGTLRAQNRTVAETQSLVADFMTTRANQLLSSQPDLVSLLADQGDGPGQFMVQASRGVLNVNIASGPGRPLWYQLSASRSETAGTGSSYLFGVLGWHHALNENALVGAMVEIDQTGNTNGASTVDGRGWLVGPYFVARLADQPLYFDGRLLWGRSRNSVSPLGTYTDTFTTTRRLATLAITGEVRRGETTWRPRLAFAYTDDEQQAYVDGLGNTIASQRVALRQVSLGLDVSMPLNTGARQWTMDAGVSASYSDVMSSGGSSPVIAATGGLRGRVDMQFRTDLGDSGQFSIGGFYDGIGAPGHRSVGGELRFEVKF